MKPVAPKAMTSYARSVVMGGLIARSGPQRAPLGAARSIVGALTAEITRRRPGTGETSVHLVLSNDAQTRVADWLVANGLASHHPTIAWAFDSADRRRSFIFYPPRGENLVEIAGR